jgi:drug/metabolite transporter (DMT)-like permease
MSLIWLPASLVAGLFQAWRTAIQHRLRAELTVSGAGLVRYLYGAPVAIALLVGHIVFHRLPLPQLSYAFFLHAAVGGLAQIIATVLLIAAFGYGNFVVGTAFSKTEALQAAVFAWLVLGETVNGLVIAGIAFGVAGVLLLSLAGNQLSIGQFLRSLKHPAAQCGLAAGALFALTGVFVKRATTELLQVNPGQTDLIWAALVTLVVVLLLQTVMHGGYVAWREPSTLRKVFVTWKISGQVGALAALGSACWFTGFAAAPVALVRIVGQVEVVFTLLFAKFYLGETTRPREVVGLLLVAVGVVFALAGGLTG